MITYTARFNQSLKQLKEDVVIDIDWNNLEPYDIVEILEPSCNLNFVNVLHGITKEGKLITKHFENDEEFMENDFKDIINNYDKLKVCEILESYGQSK